MIKRTLSLLLCLIMILGLATPAVQATSTDNVYSDDIMDNIVIEDGSDVDVVFDDVSVNTSQETKLPNPVDLVTEPTEPSSTEGTPVIETPVVEDVCKCVDLASAVDHSGICKIKAPYIAKCDASAEALFARWAGFTLVEQDFLLKTLQEKFPLKYEEFMKLLTAPTGSASETLTDGNTVSVEGIPQDGSLTVDDAADAVKDIVDAYVAEMEESTSPLFSYDVSVQDGKGADWQPETSVKMELELPGVKLHKYSKVYVVHVDDDGVATTIEATVTEDGKVAFETPGFSTFAGFTVDFDYEGVQFSIPGLTSIKLSELFENLQMPLDAADVVNVEYTDYTQLEIEQLEGDWLLTSLKAFTTTEALTLTMADGSVYNIKVTDSTHPTIAFGNNKGTNLDGDNNGAEDWHLMDYKNDVTADYSYPYSHTENYDIIIDGSSANTKTFYIILQRRSGYYGKTLYLDLHTLWIKGGANVKILLGGTITNSNTDKILIRQVPGRKSNGANDAWWLGEMIWIESGSLEIGPQYDDQSKVRIAIETQSDSLNSTIYGDQKSLINLRSGATSFKADQVDFNNFKTSAITCRADNLTSFEMTDCTFGKLKSDGTSDGVAYAGGQGGAIYIHNTADDNSTKVDITTMTLENVKFYKTEAKAGKAGAVFIRANSVGTLNVTGCTFDQTTATSHGGAMSLSDDDAAITITNANFTNCTFTSTKGTSARGGAIRAHFKTQTNLKFEGCTFNGTEAGSHGGAVAVQGMLGTFTVKNCTFTNTKAKEARGGAIGVSCSKIGNISITGTSFTGCSSGTLGGSVHFGLDGASSRISAGTVTIQNCGFKNSSAKGVGGAVCLTDGQYGSISVTGTTFENCVTNNFAGAIGMKAYAEGAKDTLGFGCSGDIKITGCTFTKCHGGSLGPDAYDNTNLGGNPDNYNTKTVTWDHDENSSTPKIDKLNGEAGGGAIVIGGTIDGNIEIKGESASKPMNFEGCTTWNNGGAVFFNGGLVVKGSSGVTMQYLNINKCFARDAGGAIYFANVQMKPFKLLNSTIQYCGYFDSNDANFTPYAPTVSKDTFSLPTVYDRNDDKDHTIKKDDKGKNIVMTTETATLQDTLYTRWSGYGNKLYASFDASGTFRTVGNTSVEATIDSCTFTGNRSYSNGGGVYWNANRVTYTDDTNTTVAVTPSMTIKNSTFDGNWAVRDGGGVYVEATVKVQSCEFKNNEAGGRGGAIAQQVYSNEARMLGSSGTDEATNLDLTAASGGTATKIYNNKAVHGGGISITTSKTVSMPDDLASYPVKFTLGGAQVYQNYATRNGGGVYYSATTYPNDTHAQGQVDRFQKEILLNSGTIYSNVAGYQKTAPNADGSTNSGGGIFMDSNQVDTKAKGYSKVTITGAAVYDNKANYGNGGGVYLTGKNALCSVEKGVIGATATSSHTPGTAKPNSCTNGSVTLNGTATNVGGNGGGIAIFGGARIEMSGGYVVNNTSTVAGGGIAVHDGSSMWFHTGGTVKNNESHMGGGISLNGAKAPGTSTADKDQYGMFLDGGTVTANYVTPDTTRKNIAYGAGICVSKGSNMKINGGTISSNMASSTKATASYAADQEGGGIAVCEASTVIITGGKIDNNKAYDGGGIAIRGDSTVTMSGSITVGTDASGNKDMVLSSNGSITNNFAYKRGGGVYMANKTVNGNTFNLTNGYVANNSVSTSGSLWGQGGGIYMGQWCVINLSGGRIENNKAYDGGGILGWRAVMKITNGEIKGNTAHRNGGGIYNDYGDVTFNNGKIYNNSATKEGGGVFCYSSSSYTAAKMTVTGGSILNNGAGTTGGGIYFEGTHSTTKGALKITGGTIQGNTAGTNGGGLYVTAATFNMEKNGVIKLNTANENGGGAYLNSVITTIKNGTLDKNTATTKKGGGIYCNAGTLNISGGTFKNNVAKADEAGGLCVYNATDVDISNGTFTNNAGMYGGGMLLYKCLDVNFTGGTFNKNYSNQGAGLFIRSCTVTIGNITVTENECKIDSRYSSDGSRYGGGMLIDSAHGPSTVTINNGTFNKNKAPHGAGMWITNNGSDVDKFITLTINGGTVQENEASGDGGGILIDGRNLAVANKYTTLTMNGGIITKNKANSGNGGGICVMGQARAFIKTGTVNGTATVGKISENSAKNGGGVYVTTGGHLTVTNGHITFNKAVKPSSVTALTTCLGNDGSLYGTGGGICVTSGASDTAKSTFILNSESGNTNMAIYGNKADFAADDVFASSDNTQLDIPQVNEMNLEGYGFKPEGWFEDYCTGDPSYTDEKGLNMITRWGGSLTLSNDKYSQVLRYRNATATQRKKMHISPALDGSANYIDGTSVGKGKAYVNMPNAYVCMTLGIPAAADDVVIIDYGIKVNINLYENDLFMEVEDFAKGSTTPYGSYMYSSRPSSTQVNLIDGVYFSNGTNPYTDKKTSLTKTYGEVSNGYSGYFGYTPNKMTMKAPDTFAYTVRHNGVWYYAGVTVLPATSIYYEDSTTFVKYHTNDDSGFIKSDGTKKIVDTLATWYTQGDVDVSSQNQDRPGSGSSTLDANNIYGYDKNYRSYTDYKFSQGSAHYVTVSRDTSDPSKTTNARATFTFQGTGFDVISMCNQKTGMVTVSVYKGTSVVYDDNPDTTKWEPTTPVKSWVVDTYYSQGGTTNDDEANLYQVPVIKCSGLPYDTYTVEIYVAPNFLSSSGRYNSAMFFLDAIRIYDPANNGASNTTIKNAYTTDGERYPTYQELRNMLIEQSKLSDNTTSGAVFIDGNAKPSLADYKSLGPNNEVYLAVGQSIAFQLNELRYIESLEDFTGADMSSVVKKVHIAMRGLGAKGTVTVAASDKSTKTLYPTATDMYYDISTFKNTTVTIKNTGKVPVALSTLKVTHTQDVTAAAQPAMTRLMTIDNETARIALEILGADQLSEPALTPKYPALSYNGMICYNVFFDAQDLGDLTEADLGLAVFDSYDENGTVETAKDVIYGATKIDDLYMIASNGVHAKYLGDTQYFRVFAKNADGSLTYSKMVSYSAAQYARGVLAKSDDVKLKQLAVAMLNYGAEAQKFFGYKTDSLMNSFVTADNQALVADFSAASLKTVGKVDASKVGSFASTGGFTRRTPSISFKGAFEINYFFTPANAVDGDMTLYFWNEDTYNSVSELTADNADKAVAMTLVDGTYIAASDEIIAKKLDQTVYVAAVYESNGVTYCSGVLPYSIAAYCQNPPAGVQDLAHAAAVYGCAAKEFFGV